MGECRYGGTHAYFMYSTLVCSYFGLSRSIIISELQSYSFCS